MSQFIRYPSNASSIPTYANFAALPATAADGAAAITVDTDTLYIFNLGSATWYPVGSPGTVLSIGTINSGTPNANGAQITGNALILQYATASVPGYVSTGVQTFAGAKTFTGAISASNLSGTNTGNVTLTAVGASGNANGASLSGQALTLQPASASFPGVLTAADWTTFNNKQAAGNYITALTGDGTASGPGSAAFTLATVNSNVGSFGGATAVGTFTVNAKGLVTAAGSTSIQIAESQVTNLVSDLAGKQPTGNYITALTGDVTAAGPGSVAATIGVNVVTNAKAAQMPTLTIKGNNTGGTANAIDLTVSQVNTMLGSLSNPMTTLGDIIYGGASGVATRLAGDTSNARKFLRELSVAGTATAPVWDTLAASDITSGTLALARGGTNQDNSSLTFPTTGTIPAITPANHGVLISSATAAANVTATGTSGQALLSNGASADPTFQTLATDMQTLVNLGLSVTASAGTLTIALKQANGSTDPSTGQAAVSTGFRSSTATSGLYNQRSVTGALSQTITSGTTLGMFNTQNNNLWLWLIDSDGAGTMKIAASTVKYDEGTLQSTVAESQTCTITIASPGVITAAGNNYVNTDAVVFTNSGGALPTGITAGTKYFVVNAGTDGAGKFRIAASPGGTAINTTGSQSGTHTLRCACYRMVSDAAYTNMPARLIGRVVFNLVTAGTWIAPSEVSIANLGMAAAKEFIGIRYTSNSAQAMVAGNNTVVGFGTKVRDSHGTTNAVDTTGWYWVCPQAGQYFVSSEVATASTAWIAGDSFQLKIVKSNDSSNSILGATAVVQAAFTEQLYAAVATSFNLAQGDYIWIFGTPTHGSNVNTGTQSGRTQFIDIFNVGPAV